MLSFCPFFLFFRVSPKRPSHQLLRFQVLILPMVYSRHSSFSSCFFSLFSFPTFFSVFSSYVITPPSIISSTLLLSPLLFFQLSCCILLLSRQLPNSYSPPLFSHQIPDFFSSLYLIPHSISVVITTFLHLSLKFIFPFSPFTKNLWRFSLATLIGTL